MFASFNPRARVGRDTALNEVRAKVEGFNPRARVGRDRIAAIRLGGLAEFQSTRPRGARQKPVALYKWLLSFNPRARVGRDIIAGRLV